LQLLATTLRAVVDFMVGTSFLIGTMQCNYDNAKLLYSIEREEWTVGV
jgi:hypothetical protein